MRRTIIGASLLLALLLFSVTSWASSSPLLAQGARTGLFGQVSSVATPSPGLTVITLESVAQGRVELESNESTLVRVPSHETASAADIVAGDFLAILAERRTGQRPLALSILVKPTSPVTHTHFRGAVIGTSGDQILLMDSEGNVMAADLMLEDRTIGLAEVVTAVVRQDLRSGNAAVLAAEPVDEKLARLEAALKNATRSGATENVKNLKGRLEDTTSGHLTTAQRILDRVDPGVRLLFSNALESALLNHKNRLRSFEAGRPTLKVSGTIEVVERSTGIIRVSQQEGPELELRFTDATTIREFGAPSRSGNLLPGQRIEARYDPESRETRSVDIVFPTLDDKLGRHILRQVRTHELEGALSLLANPPRVAITLVTGKTVTLSTTAETRIRVDEVAAALSDLQAGDTVKVRYDPADQVALSIDTFDQRPGRSFVSGVVQSLVAKIRPGVLMPGHTQEGNLAVLTPGGATVVLTITDSTVIERNGLRMSIAAVRRGDQVRPISRYSTATREVQLLALVPPELEGTVRGKVVAPSGRRYVTITTDSLNLVTVQVEEESEFQALNPGQKVKGRSFDPASGTAPGLVGSPAKALRTKGAITSLDQAKGIVTLRTSGRQSIELLVPQKPGIITLNGKPRSVSDLRVGDEVRMAFYKPNRVVVSMVVTSR